MGGVRVPLPADPVQRHVEQARILRRQVEQDHGHGREAGAAGDDEPLVAGDQVPVGAPRQHGLDDPERGDRAGQGRQFVLPDAARVARIRVQVRDRQVLDGEGAVAAALVVVIGTPPSGADFRDRAAGGGRADRPIGPRSRSPRLPAA